VATRAETTVVYAAGAVQGIVLVTFLAASMIMTKLDGRIAPSGAQIGISPADQRAVVVEVGGGLRSWSVSEVERLDGYGANEMCSSGPGQVLTPWPTILAEGSYEFDENRHQLPLTAPAK
jgi:hypothetical protein